MQKRRRAQFYDGAAAVPLYVCFLCVGIVCCLLAFHGYIRVYLLGDARKTEAVTDGSYLFSLNPGEENKYINYRFTADGGSFYGRATVFRDYRAGQKVIVFYDADNPKKNGLLQTHWLAFAMGVGISAFSAAGLWHVRRRKR